MVFHRREKSTIECPRCSQKSLIGMESCPGCGLIFSRMEIATNKDAKRKMHRGDRDFIVYTSKLPGDVKFIKLLLFMKPATHMEKILKASSNVTIQRRTHLGVTVRLC